MNEKINKNRLIQGQFHQPRLAWSAS